MLFTTAREFGGVWRRSLPEDSSLGFFLDFCKRVFCGGDAECPLLLSDDGLDRFLLTPCSELAATKVSLS